MEEPKFWRDIKLSHMTPEQWESLCDGCGLCCLRKIEDSDSGEIAYTDVACRLLDIDSCQCANYPHRKKLVPDCVVLTPDQISEFHWLPDSCAYRMVSEGKDLSPWHPLVSGSANSVHDAGISVQGRVISERNAGDMMDHIINLQAFCGHKEGPE